MRTYILALECECGATMQNRVGDLTASGDDELIIDIAMTISQTTFGCDNCGARYFLGDLEDIVFQEDS